LEGNIVMATTLGELFHYLDGLQGRAPLAELTAELAELEIGPEVLTAFTRFSDRHYMRNLVRSGPWYFVLVLCWKNGQRSPIHDHRGSACGVRVLRGTATETQFEFAPNGLVKATFSRDVPQGSVIGSEDTDLHQVSNLQSGNADLVTLHVYSPPLEKMGTYSLTDGIRGEEPMLLELSDAAGI
jgi:cysteine dioxygenase